MINKEIVSPKSYTHSRVLNKRLCTVNYFWKIYRLGSSYFMIFLTKLKNYEAFNIDLFYIEPKTVFSKEMSKPSLCDYYQSMVTNFHKKIQPGSY